MILANGLSLNEETSSKELIILDYAIVCFQAAEDVNGAPKIFEDKKLSTPRISLLLNFAL